MYKATLCTFPTYSIGGGGRGVDLCSFVMGFVLSFYFLIGEIVKYLIYYCCAQRTSAILIQYRLAVFNVRIFFFCSSVREYVSKPAFFSPYHFPFPPLPFLFSLYRWRGTKRL